VKIGSRVDREGCLSYGDAEERLGDGVVDLWQKSHNSPLSFDIIIEYT
jgi:hypothetical protein